MLQRCRHWADQAEAPASAPPEPASVPDDRGAVEPGDRVLLVVEDDGAFAHLLAELGHEHGFKVVVAMRGTDAFDTACDLRPDAITFDIGLPDLDGWRLLGRLKDDPQIRHIPVLLVSGADDAERGLRMGAIGCVSKPASRTQLRSAFDRLRQMVEKPTRRLLVVDRDASARERILELIGNTDVSVTSASGIDSLQSLAEPGVDCMVLVVREQGDAELELLRRLEHSPEHQRLPVVLFLDGSSPEIEHEVRRLGRSLVLKEVRSPERLLDETARFSTEVLAGRTVLIVGDDVRNIFAMTSLLERHGMQVISAENGSEALSRLESTPGIELVLMDVMLPGMDGYETTRAIRQLPSRASLPILALTAKAMKGDREKCLEAGASDYIAKPVEAEHLVAQLRSWLHR